MEAQNVVKKPDFVQVYIWPGTIVGNDQIVEFEKFMQETFDIRVQYLEEILTSPDMRSGNVVTGTGGRCDLFFAVHNDDINKFAVPRLQYGIRYIEDALSPVNGGNKYYPERVKEYKTW